MEEKKFFNFNSDKEFNLNEEYNTLFNGEQFKVVDPNDKKLQDAEDIINELGGLYMEGSSLQKYELAYVNFNQFLDKFGIENKDVTIMTKDDRDKLFGYGKELFMYYQAMYSNLHFNFELSRKEWAYVEHTLTKKLSYNGNEIFNFMELNNKFIKPTHNTVDNLHKDINSFVPVCSIQSLLLLSHLLMKHEEKGGSDSFIYFSNVLSEIAKMTKLFNAYGVILERVSNRFDRWVSALNAIDEVYGEPVEPIIPVENVKENA